MTPCRLRLLRLSYRQKLRVDQQAQAASMSPSAFHKHFKDYTTLTPVQYQKRLHRIRRVTGSTITSTK